MASKMTAADKANQANGQALYNACREKLDENPDYYFAQEDFEAYNVIPRVQIGPAMQWLVDNHMAKLFTQDGEVVFRMRPEEVARRLRTASVEFEDLIYALVEDTGNLGLWTKTLKSKAGLQANVFNRAVKSLETKKLIKLIVSVKAPTKKMYMLYNLSAADDVAGGAFYDQGELDTGLIYELQNIIRMLVQQRSWDVGFEPVPPEPRPGNPIDARKRQEAVYAAGGGRAGSKFAPPAPTRAYARPFAPSYADYPTTDSLLRSLNAAGLLTNVTLSKRDLQMVLDAMVYDGKLEAVSEETYRVSRPALSAPGDSRASLWADIEGADIEEVGNGFTRSPCSRCPVFNLCEEGGPVSAGNCEYFERWLRPKKNKMVLEEGMMLTQGLKERVDALRMKEENA